MRTISPKDTLAIDFHNALKPTRYFSKIKEALNQMIQKTAMRLKTIQNFCKTWEYNFRANKNNWLNTPSVSSITTEPPELFILGGPSVDDFLRKNQLDSKTPIWSADTALILLLTKKKQPNLIFSIDAGFGSFEHYIYARYTTPHKLSFVLDPLCFPKYYSLDIKKYTYASSHPLIQNTIHNHQILVNQNGDVYGIMKALYHFLFPGKTTPHVIGHDQRAIHHITHLRGSAYHYRRYHKMSRLNSPESYFYNLSKTY